MVENWKLHAGEDHLTIRQPDGTLALIPAWMVLPTAAGIAIVSEPRLPLDRLLCLSAYLRSCLTPKAEESSRQEEERHAMQGPPTAKLIRDAAAKIGDRTRSSVDPASIDPDTAGGGAQPALDDDQGGGER